MYLYSNLNSMDKNVNPWTGKAKTTKNTGLFNDILFNHYPEMQRPNPPSQYIEMSKVIQKQTNNKGIEQYHDLFDLKSKIQKIDQISDWIQKIQNSSKEKNIENETPIDSSFVYIPVHAYNTFHDILRDCLNGSKEVILKEQALKTLIQEIKQFEETLNLNDTLESNVL